MPTIDPQLIPQASDIPPVGAQPDGTSAQGLVDVFFGTLPGDVDAQPAAAELLATAPDTGGLANADFIYNQVSKVFGGVQLPDFQSPSGRTVKSVVFVSGSPQGGFGAFHFPGTQTDFDRIVTDSLTISGDYSAGSTVVPPGAGPSSLAPAGPPRLLPMFQGEHGSSQAVDANDPGLKEMTPEALQKGFAIVSQHRAALHAAIDAKKSSAPVSHHASHHAHGDLVHQLVQANRDVASMIGPAAASASSRQFLSTALFAAEIIESFEMLTGKGNSGKTDGEAVSRVVSFKLAPEITLVPGFNSGVTQQWWADGHPDFVNDNSQTDQSTDGNAAGVMFLLFLNDFLGVPLDTVLAHMPAVGGSPLGNTYVALLADIPALSAVAGTDGPSAFQAMIALLTQNTQNPDGTLNLPADGNPFPAMPNSKQGGLFAP